MGWVGVVKELVRGLRFEGPDVERKINLEEIIEANKTFSQESQRCALLLQIVVVD